MAEGPCYDLEESLEADELVRPCYECEPVWTVRGMPITVNLRVYQDVSLAIFVRSKDALLRKLRKKLDHLSPLRLETERCAREEPTWPSQRSKVGSKRGLLETTDIANFLHHLQRCSGAPSPSPSPSRHDRGSDRSYRKGRDSKSSKTANLFIKCRVEFQYIFKTIFPDVLPMPCLESLSLANEVTTLSNLDLPELHSWWLKDEHPVDSAKKRKIEVLREEAVLTDWNSLPFDLQDKVFQKADLKTLVRCKALSKACKQHIESDAFCQSRGATSEEGSFTAISYYIRNNAWQCSGYDTKSKLWRSLPTFSYLPAPDADLFKEFSVSGHHSLLCGHLSKLPEKGELVVFNPLTGKKRVLPPLLYPRNPVLVHISFDSGEKSYTVVVAGSSSASDEHLSKKVEVFRSTTSKWTEASDVPGPVFGLNEHQAGVSINGILYLIAFLEGSCHRGVVAFDLKNGTWLENHTFPIPFSLHSNTLQLVECNGKLHLFSEQEQGASVEHCIDLLESSRGGARQWRDVVRVKRLGGRGLQVYPEHTCVNFGDGKLCVLNTLSRDGVVYDMQDGKEVAALPPPPANQKGDHFFTLNPASFTLQPRFDTDPILPVHSSQFVSLVENLIF